MKHLLLDVTKYSDTWWGHVDFAKWVANKFYEPTIVDLGVDYGLSTFSFALGNPLAKVTGIDSFEGDPHSGRRDTESFCKEFKDKHNIKNVSFLKGYFDDYAPQWPEASIDVLHIDGLHTYEAVKLDFETWLPKVKRDGIILMHDTRCYREGFGVHDFFLEIDMPKLNFSDYWGLGVVSRSANNIEKIYDTFSNEIDYVFFPGKR